MTESTVEILKLIYQKKSVNEITEELNISRKKLYNILRQIKNKGYEINRKYYYNGDIFYSPKRSFLLNDGIDIITSSDDKVFEALVISDLHIGSVKQRLDLLNKAYDYCTKNGIHIIIVCGDIIDGMFGPYLKIHDNISDQIDYVIKNYPFDKNILNFATLGDHDYDAMQKYGLNFATILENYRHDIIPLGYGIGRINIKNDCIFVRHPAPAFDELKINPNKMKNFLVLCGHSHQMKFNYNPSGSMFYIPTLSDLPGNNISRPPSAVKMNLEFTNGMITCGIFSHLIFDKDIYEMGEFKYRLGSGKDISGNNPIKLEEDITTKKVLKRQ